MKRESILNNKESSYKNHVNAKIGKSYLTHLSNLGLILVLSGILFVLFKLIGDNIPSVKQDQEISVETEKMYGEEAQRAGLIIYEDGKKVDEETLITRALRNEAKTALIHYNIQSEYENFPIYKTSDVITKDTLQNNFLLNYYCGYKVKYTDFYEKNPAKPNYFCQFYDEILVKISDNVFYSPSENNELRYLTPYNTRLIADYYFKQDIYESNEKIVKDFSCALSKTNNGMVDDFKLYNVYANGLLKDHDKAYYKYAESLIGELLVAYLVANFLTFMVPYFVKKDYDSVGAIICKSPICRSNGKQINVLNSFGIFFINVLQHFYSLFAIILIIFGNPRLAFHSYGIINIGVLSIFSLTLNLASFLVMIFTKSHQYLDSLSMLCYRKNRDEIKIETESKEVENGK